MFLFVGKIPAGERVNKATVNLLYLHSLYIWNRIETRAHRAKLCYQAYDFCGRFLSLASQNDVGDLLFFVL